MSVAPWDEFIGLRLRDSWGGMGSASWTFVDLGGGSRLLSLLDRNGLSYFGSDNQDVIGAE